MSPQNKTYILIAGWLVLTGIVFGSVFPRLSTALVDLKQSHEKQLSELASLQAQALALEKMQNDLKEAGNQPVQISALFTSDTTLVNEVQRIEEIAAKTGMQETLTISGTADKAQIVQSQSGLLNVPYTVNLHGSYPNFIAFLKYLENSYFVSPVNAFTVNYDTQGAVNVSLLSNFYLRK